MRLDNWDTIRGKWDTDAGAERSAADSAENHDS